MRGPRLETLLLGVALITPISNAAHAQCTSALPPSNTKIVQVGNGSGEQWPWLAVLRLREVQTNYETFICGGSVINTNWIVTAAHCLKNQFYSIAKRANGFYETENGLRLEVVLGVDNLMGVSHGNVHEVRNAILHDRYVRAEDGDDIALIQLSTHWSGAVCPTAKLPEGPFGWSLALRVAGFGAQSSSASPKEFTRVDGTKFRASSAQLKQVTLVEANHQVCKTAYSNWKAAIGPGQICAGLRWNGDDSCQGDSGGPLVAMDNAQCPNLVGIVSWGDGCGLGGRYGVYTRISHYESWISEKITGSTAVKVASKTTTPPSLAETQRQLLAQLDEALRPVKGKVRVAVSAGERAQLGSKYVIDIDSDVTGKLIILNIDSKGYVWQLYPNRSTIESVIPAGKTLTVPSKEMGFDYVKVVAPLGKERFVVIVVPPSFPYKTLVGSEEVSRRGVSPEGKLLSKIPIQERDRGKYLINLVHQVLRTLESGSGVEKPGSSWAYNTVEFETFR